MSAHACVGKDKRQKRRRAGVRRLACVNGGPRVRDGQAVCGDVGQHEEISGRDAIAVDWPRAKGVAIAKVEAEHGAGVVCRRRVRGEQERSGEAQGAYGFGHDALSAQGGGRRAGLGGVAKLA